MKSEPEAMSYAAELLRSILEDDSKQLSHKQLAQLAGKDLSTIYRYCDGTLTVPVEVLAAAFRATMDMRLANLIPAGSPYRCELVSSRRAGVRIPPLGECFDLACKSARDAVEVIEQVKSINEDGRITELDIAHINALRTVASQLIHRNHLLLARVEIDAREAGVAQ